jgi:hypothetical protein
MNPDDNDIATALIASMRRSGVIGRRRNDSPEVAEAVDRCFDFASDYRAAFTPDDGERAFTRRQGKRMRKLVLRKLGINDRSDVERV